MKQLIPVGIAAAFHVFDLLTGLIGAVRNKDIESSKMRDGLFKKVGYLFCYALALMMDNFGGEIGLNLSVSILPAVVVYAVTTEIVSIIENITKINPDFFPEKLKELFHMKGGE